MKRVLVFVLMFSILLSGIICVHAEENDGNTQDILELKNMGDLSYYLYTPSDSTDHMPLIIYLHGGTNKSLDVTALLTTDGFPQYLNDGYYGDLRAYVVVPKLDSSYKGWVNIYEKIRDLINSMERNYSIDKNKVALTGHSMGGTGTYQLQLKLPNSFACIAPMSGSVQKNTDANIAALSKTKIWAFVGTDDTIVDPDSSCTVIQALQNDRADARITELSGATHFDVPLLAYKNNDLIQWLVNCGETTENGMLLGDVDGDQAVTIIDATVIQRHLASIPVSVYHEEAADTDADKSITIIDATFIQRWLASLPSNDNIGKVINNLN